MIFSSRTVGLAAVFTLAATLVSPSAQASITFTFDYSGNTPGVGFLDPVEGAARQNALTQAGVLFSNMFGSLFTNSANLTLAVTSTNDGGLPTLASAGSNFNFAPGTFGGGEVISTKLLTGTDLNGGALDGYVDVNWGYVWELDPNNPAVPPGPGETWDFYAALFHEFTHALGFGSEISGTPGHDRFGQGEEGGRAQGSWSLWDRYLAACGGNTLINTGTFQVDQTAFGTAQSNGGCFIGANAMAANGGLVQLFANPDQSHLDEATFPVSMMKPFRDYGPESRVYNSVEIGILRDLGYTPVDASAVPEPQTYLLFLSSGVLFGGLKRFRRKV